MPSRLAEERSAYLRSARDQPVDWHPWAPDAFARARSEGKPILLDIGAVWCHWCHVMDHESYEHPAVADLLNRDWICIKVDRDERPDVDARYQRAVQALTGQGGWPLTAFLTPEGEVFYGGTYFPPDDRWGRPGFRHLLETLARLFRDDPARVRAQAATITSHLAMARPESAAAAGPLTEDLLRGAADGMARLFDPRDGGFGTQPKFPHPGAGEFVLSRWFDTAHAWAADVVYRTLTAMACGGIRDHLGGGFHRYAMDSRWIVPHFEKMIHDNSELLRLYVHTSSAPAMAAAPESHREGDVSYREVIEEIIDWVLGVMADPAGGYYASQDADVGHGDDGDYFTWTRDEVAAVLAGDELEVVLRRYDIALRGEMRHDPHRNVLWIAQPLEQIAAAIGRSRDAVAALLASGRAKLRAARQARAAPFVDPALYVSWNAMMASAMLEAAAWLGRAELERHALATLERLFREAADPAGGLRHMVGGATGGLLEDQVHAAQAALDAFEATGDERWLDRSKDLMEIVWREYRSEGGALRDTRKGAGGEGFLAQEVIPIQDSPTPSANGVAGIALARLAELTGREAYRQRRDELLEALAGSAAELSIFGATLLRAIDWAVMPPTHIVIVGDDTEARPLLRTARSVFRPRKVVRWLRPGAATDTLPAPLRAMLDGAAPRAYVCLGSACAPPAATEEELASLLRVFGRAGSTVGQSAAHS